MKLPPMLLIGILAGVCALGGLLYFSLGYLRSKPIYHEARETEMAKKAKQGTPAAKKRPNNNQPKAPEIIDVAPKNVSLPSATPATTASATGTSAAAPAPAYEEVPVVPTSKQENKQENIALLPKNSSLIANAAPAPGLPLDIVPAQRKPKPIQATPTNGNENGANEAPAIPLETLRPVVPETSTAPAPTRPANVVYAHQRFLFRNLTADKGDDIGGAGGDDKAANIDVEHFAPEGETIDICLVNNVASNNTEVEAICAVWTPFYWNGRQILEIGDHILGTAAAGHNRDRLIVNFKKIIFKDGRSTPISAIGLHTDGTLGIKGYRVGNPFVQALAPMLTDLVSGVAQALSQQTTTTSAVTGLTTTVSPTNILQSGGSTAAQKSLDRLSAIMQKENDENAPYIFVPAGTRAIAYLKSYLDVSSPDYGK